MLSSPLLCTYRHGACNVVADLASSIRRLSRWELLPCSQQGRRYLLLRRLRGVGLGPRLADLVSHHGNEERGQREGQREKRVAIWADRTRTGITMLEAHASIPVLLLAVHGELCSARVRRVSYNNLAVYIASICITYAAP